MSTNLDVDAVSKAIAERLAERERKWWAGGAISDYKQEAIAIIAAVLNDAIGDSYDPEPGLPQPSCSCPSCVVHGQGNVEQPLADTQPLLGGHGTIETHDPAHVLDGGYCHACQKRVLAMDAAGTTACGACGFEGGDHECPAEFQSMLDIDEAEQVFQPPAVGTELDLAVIEAWLARSPQEEIDNPVDAHHDYTRHYAFALLAEVKRLQEESDNYRVAMGNLATELRFREEDYGAAQQRTRLLEAELAALRAERDTLKERVDQKTAVIKRLRTIKEE